MSKKKYKTEMLRTRCDGWLKLETERIAMAQGLDQSDILRLALRRYIHDFNSQQKTEGVLITADA